MQVRHKLVLPKELIMVRNYKRITNKASYPFEKLQEAVRAVKNGELSGYKAAKIYNIPRMTIMDHLHNKRRKTIGRNSTEMTMIIKKEVDNDDHRVEPTPSLEPENHHQEDPIPDQLHENESQNENVVFLNEYNDDKHQRQDDSRERKDDIHYLQKRNYHLQNELLEHQIREAKAKADLAELMLKAYKDKI